MTYTPRASAASGVQSTVTSQAVALGSAVSIDDLIVVAVSRSNPGNTDTYGLDTVADSLGNTYAILPNHVADTSDVQSLAMFWSIATVAGTPTTTVTFNESSNFAATIVAAFPGVRKSNPLDTFGSTGGALPQRVQIVGADMATLCSATPEGAPELAVYAFSNFANSQVTRAIDEMVQLQAVTQELKLAYTVLDDEQPYNARVYTAGSCSCGGIVALFRLDQEDAVDIPDVPRDSARLGAL